jgi:hypothetical protein
MTSEPTSQAADPGPAPESVVGTPDEGVFSDGTGEVYPPPPYATALQVDDPPKIGEFWLDARMAARASGITYLAHGADDEPVMLILLSEGAAGDAAARERFSAEINKMHVDTVIARGGANQDEGRLAGKFRDTDDDPIEPDAMPLVPWAVLAFDGSQDALAEADRVLRSVDLSSSPEIGHPSGPDYRLHWIQRTKPGNWRLWPLPWPGRKDRAGWMSILVSWLLMIVLAALALLIVVLVFQNLPEVSAPPPVPQPSQGQGSGSGSPQEPSGSGSASASTTPSEGESSASASTTPSDSASDSASPSGSGAPQTPTVTMSMNSPSPGDSGDGPSTMNSRL